MVAAAGTPRAPGAPETSVTVDPAIARLAGDVARPARTPPVTRGLDHLPGRRGGWIQSVRWIRDFMSRGADAVSDHVARYGPVSRVPFRLGEAVLVCDPELVSRLARNGDQAWSAALAWKSFFDGIGLRESLGTIDFEVHKDARRVLQPAFAPAALASYLSAASPLIEQAAEGWLARGEAPFKKEVRALLASVSSRIFLGDVANGPMLDRALRETWSGPYAVVKNRWLSPTWRRSLRGHRTMFEALVAMIPERRARGGADFFSRLCSETLPADWSDDETLVGQFVGVMLGAFDTTSAGITSMAYLLARHPDWQERLRQEAMDAGPGPLGLQQVQALEVTDRVWKETLRFYPIISGIPRCALRDLELGGFAVPAGTYAFGMIGPAQRDASWWTNPRTFDPDRFSAARAEDKKKPGLFMPFGAGAHACIGLQLATLEVKAFWHAVLRRGRIRLKHDYEARHTYTPMGSVSGDVDLVFERA